MRIVRLQIENFRGIRKGTFFPDKHNVYLGPNNIGKTTILEALNLLLNPEIGTRQGVVDENDFYRRQYRAAHVQPATAAKADAIPEAAARVEAAAAAASPSPVPPAATTAPSTDGPAQTAESSTGESAVAQAPIIRIEAVLADLTDEEANADFANVLVPWKVNERDVVEAAAIGEDPFAGAERAIRPCFEAWYDEEDDNFAFRTYFRTDPALERDACPQITRRHKRAIGFLIYRDFRALQRPITLEPAGLFARLLQSQDATPRTFDDVLERLKGAAAPLFADNNFARVVNEYRQELSRYLPLAPRGGEGHLAFEVTDRTREDVKEIAQLYVEDVLALPLQRMGAGTRSLSLLAILLLIARKRNGGILALEEPETFLFPHAQRRIVDEVLALASQSFVTTHSPYVLERMPLDGYQRVAHAADGTVTAERFVHDAKTGRIMRDRHRRQLAEGLLGRAVIVVEEESVRHWILRASALLHGADYDGSKRSAMELHGVTVLNVGGNGEVPIITKLLTNAGIHAIGFLDQVEDRLYEQFRSQGVPLVFHGRRNLEDLLCEQLPRPLLEAVLTTSSIYRKLTYASSEIAALDERALREKAKKYFTNHKGYLPFHEEVLDALTVDDMPATFKRVVCIAQELSDGTLPEPHTIWPM